MDPYHDLVGQLRTTVEDNPESNLDAPNSNKSGRNRGRSKTQKPVDATMQNTTKVTAIPRKERNKLRNSNGSRNRHEHKPNEPKEQQQQQQQQKERSSKPKQGPFPPHSDYNECMTRYASHNVVRGILRVLPGRDASAFVTCDRGSTEKDILIATRLDQNRALHGDMVFVELLHSTLVQDKEKVSTEAITNKIASVSLQKNETEYTTWQDDNTQVKLWNPKVAIRRAPDFQCQLVNDASQPTQCQGRVICVIPPKGSISSELTPSDERKIAPTKTIVGLLKSMTRADGSQLHLLTPSNRVLPQFLTPSFLKPQSGDDGLYRADYVYGSWKEGYNWPPCTNVKFLGRSCNIEDETMALLVENGVDYGEFEGPVLKDVQDVVASGLILQSNNADDLGWQPTPEMYEGRRDYRTQRIFTIDPTTARDLDDALHITKLPDGRVEIGVHIADVSYFVQPNHAVDEEAQRRATTVYLVDRVIPMLPRPLCEVACSLNENVERLAFSCVWTMNMDGTLPSSNGKNDDVWYGRTVIKSCARLDYATAQNIIDMKVGNGEAAGDMDAKLWPASRRPCGLHTVDQVAADVRLMHQVAMARRQLRFENGAIALNGVKMTFQWDSDEESPSLCAPYPIRDSNRLIEEYMLLANFLVAQRLVTHAGHLACLRHHLPPLMDGLQSVVQIAMEEKGIAINLESSRALQQSLSRLGRECHDELVMQCVTEMLMKPFKPAEYFAAGQVDQDKWKHFALNIPYYTHFTSPIRRYPDVIVHRLLQATLDGTIDDFDLDQNKIQSVCTHCNDKKMASRQAQDRSDRIFLSLFLKKHPLKSALGVVLSVGDTTFTIYVPSIGVSAKLFLDEHKDMVTFEPYVIKTGKVGGEKRLRLTCIGKHGKWSQIDIKMFCKLSVNVLCKEKPPIDVKLMLEGPWLDEAPKV